MTNERPKVSPSSRYCESEAARLLGVNRRTIARWRESGQIRPASEWESSPGVSTTRARR